MTSKKFLFTIFMCHAIYGLCYPIITSIWTEISQEILVEASLLGVLVTINCIASAISSFCTYKIRQKLGTNYTNVLGLSLFAAGVIVFMNVNSFSMMVVGMILFGLANGIIDINSNSYVVKAYEAKWVSIMHSCWGLASSVGPIIMSFAIMHTSTYKNGFKVILVLIIGTIITLILLKRSWKVQREKLDKEIVALHSVTEEEKKGMGIVEFLKMKGIVKMLLCFAFANGAGCAFMAWVATIFVAQKGVSVVEGATAVTAYSVALMLGRVVMGFAADKIGIKNIIRGLAIVASASILLIFIPYKNVILVYINSALAGFASGPLIPLLNSDIKNRFDKKVLSELIGFGGVFGLGGVASLSAIMTIASKIISINYIHVIPAIGFLLLFVIYSSLAPQKAD